MEFIKIKEGFYYFKSAVNIGYIHSNDKKSGMLIDAGLEASAAKKVLRVLQEKNFPFTHLFITHAHADHFGGAQYLQKNYDIHTIAPDLEDGIMRNPILEPMYLFHGNTPLKEMRNKFLEAPAIQVDEICNEGKWTGGSLQIEFIPIPGHSYNQYGLKFKDVLYAADAFLGLETLSKHKIPFIVDATANLSTLEYLIELNIDGMLPGHGSYLSDYKNTIQSNIDVHLRLYGQVLNLLIVCGERGISLEDLIANMLVKNEIDPVNLGMYALFRTAITAYIIKLIEEKKAVYRITEGRPVIFSGQSSA